MTALWEKFKAWLFPCGCYCCTLEGFDLDPGAIPRREVDGLATLWAKPSAKGETPCAGADSHDLTQCDPPCNVCDSGRNPRCPDCGAAV